MSKLPSQPSFETAEAVLSSFPSSTPVEACPPFTNRGGTLPDPIENKEEFFVSGPEGVQEGAQSSKLLAENEFFAFLAENSKFDWFQASLPNPETCKAACEVGTEQEADLFRRVVKWATLAHHLVAGTPGTAPGVFRSRVPFMSEVGDKESLIQLYSGSSTGGTPNVAISGGDGKCSILAPSFQKSFSGSFLSRADVCIDLSQPGLFDDLYAQAKLFKASQDAAGKKRPGFKPLRLDRLQSANGGATVYVNDRAAEVSFKFYLKDFERVADGKLALEDADPDLVRLEFTFRPSTRDKKGMFPLQPSEMLLGKLFSRSFLERVRTVIDMAGDRLQRVQFERKPKPDESLERAVSFGAKQYGATFVKAAVRSMCAEQGKHLYNAKLDPRSVFARAIGLFGAELLNQDTLSKTLGALVPSPLLDPDSQPWQRYAEHQWRSSRIILLNREAEHFEASVRSEAWLEENGPSGPYYASNIPSISAIAFDMSASAFSDNSPENIGDLVFDLPKTYVSYL